MKKLLIAAIILILYTGKSIAQTTTNKTFYIKHNTINLFNYITVKAKKAQFQQAGITTYIQTKKAVTIPFVIQFNWADPIQILSDKTGPSTNDILHAGYKGIAIHCAQYVCLSMSIKI